MTIVVTQIGIFFFPFFSFVGVEKSKKKTAGDRLSHTPGDTEMWKRPLRGSINRDVNIRTRRNAPSVRPSVRREDNQNEMLKQTIPTRCRAVAQRKTCTTIRRPIHSNAKRQSAVIVVSGGLYVVSESDCPSRPINGQKKQCARRVH